jgi:multimeric flavodoxin WrbA
MLAEARRWEAFPVARLLVVFHSRSGGTRRLLDSALAGARMALGSGEDAAVEKPTTELEVKHAFDTGVDDLGGAGAVLIATPANFGYMSGAMKDFFERVYHPCLEQTVGMPYSMIVKGDTDVDGAAASVERIATGMRWRLVLPPVLVVGDATGEQVDAAYELGASLAAGLDAGIY